MDPEARLRTVLSGGIADRVPFIPLLYYFAAVYAGVPIGEFLTSMNAYRRAMDRCFYEVGPWDAMYPLPFTMDAPDYDITCGAGVGMKPSLPETEEQERQGMQFKEMETLMVEGDYEEILDLDQTAESEDILDLE